MIRIKSIRANKYESMRSRFDFGSLSVTICIRSHIHCVFFFFWMQTACRRRRGRRGRTIINNICIDNGVFLSSIIFYFTFFYFILFLFFPCLIPIIFFLINDAANNGQWPSIPRFSRFEFCVPMNILFATFR